MDFLIVFMDEMFVSLDRETFFYKKNPSSISTRGETRNEE